MITPMVARLVRDPFDREGWLFELKWDGFRTIAEIDGTDGVKLYSRNQSDFKKRFPPIADAPERVSRGRGEFGICMPESYQQTLCKTLCKIMLSRLKSLATLAVIANCTQNDHSTNPSKYVACSRFMIFRLELSSAGEMPGPAGVFHSSMSRCLARQGFRRVSLGRFPPTKKHSRNTP